MIKSMVAEPASHCRCFCFLFTSGDTILSLLNKSLEQRVFPYTSAPLPHMALFTIAASLQWLWLMNYIASTSTCSLFDECQLQASSTNNFKQIKTSGVFIRWLSCYVMVMIPIVFTPYPKQERWVLLWTQKAKHQIYHNKLIIKSNWARWEFGFLLWSVLFGYKM